MYDQIRNDTLFGMLYAVVSALFLAACCYLLFRQGNAFARDVTPPVRLRRWTAAYFAATAVCHLWYMQIFFLTSAEDIMMTDLIGGLLDSVLAVPLVICVMLNMLQDRRRPLWPIPLMIACFARRDNTDAGCATTMPTWSTRRCGRVLWYWPSCSCCSSSIRF